MLQFATDNDDDQSYTPDSVVNPRCNLDRFLDSTTPLLPVYYFSKTTMRGWKTCDVEFMPYFTLADLWDSFEEWSAYGTGVPLVIDGRNDNIVQYYVPYLSGIQLYGESSSRRIGEDSDGDSFRDSSSDGSSDYEFDKNRTYSKKLRGFHNLTDELTNETDDMSLSNDENSDDSETGNARGCLLFEYLEYDPPYSREPLANKVLDLTRLYPGLKTLKSCDVLPISWMSVAWYPIYRIPTGPTLKDLDACFLTYHFLSTPIGGDQLPGGGNTQPPVIIYPSESGGVPKISLPMFGMASYKFNGSMWNHNGCSETQLANSLTQAADNWLRLQRVNHPDFQFFATHGMYQR
ncbi:hypothetical protein ACFE04_006930 [Oxalis oulophora]